MYSKTAVLALLVCFTVLTITQGSDRFVNFGITKDDPPDIIPLYDNKVVDVWNASWPFMARILLLQPNESASISLACPVNLTGPDVLTHMDFCFEITWKEPPQCTTLNARRTRALLRVGRARNIPVRLAFDPWRGGSASLTEIPPGQTLGGLAFSCKANNRFGSRESNQVQLFDSRLRIPRTPVTFDRVMTFNLSGQVTDRPGSSNPGLRCLERELAGELNHTVRYEWRVCNGASQRDDGCKLVGEIPNWRRVQILPNGRLYWSHVPKETAEELKGKRLKCYVGRRLVAIYKHGLKFKESDPGEPSLIEPQGKMKFKVFDSPTIRFTLPLLINNDTDNVTAAWTPKNTVQCSENHLNLVHCAGAFDDENNQYKVTIIKNGGRGKRSTPRHGTFVGESLEGYPKLEKFTRTRIFVVDGHDGKLTCHYRKQQHVISSLTIIGTKLDFDSQQSLHESVSTINSYFSDVMVPLNVTINGHRPQKGQKLSYTVHRMRYRSPRHRNLSSSHYVECVGYRGDYTVRYPVSFQVVPRPEMDADGTPSATTCNSSVCHFSCLVANKKKIEGFGVVIKVAWHLGGKPLKDYKTEIRRWFSGTEEELIFNASQADDSVKKEINNQTISCAVQMRYPSSEKSEVFYSSDTDRALARSMVASIRMEMDPDIRSEYKNSSKDTRVRMKNIVTVISVVVIIIIVGFLSFVAICIRKTKTKRRQSQQDSQAQLLAKFHIPSKLIPENKELCSTVDEV